MADVLTKRGDGDTLEQIDTTKTHGTESSVESLQALTSSSLKRHLRKVYGRLPTELVKRYLRAILDLSACVNKAPFMARCMHSEGRPAHYRVACPDVTNTHCVIRVLDKCS
ncbi:hypothetical protein HPB52_014207 [Rhipicephalus sanguineus]|uniref:Uncharacterized protein n=1 Tax=Rhipicephalus sanguineus TaxID=34632 RepID=A0A9D4PWD0_RHISA|nr:hypothetical protein HPB52_014207 [Rhipicephalus sanguineus]